MLPVLDRCFLKELLYNMAFALAVITSVFFTGAAVKFLHKYPDLDLVILLKVLPFFLLYHLEFVLPLSLLVAVVLVYGRAAAANEITTIKASGIHPYRILLPAFLIAAVVTLASSYTSNHLSPRAEANFKEQISSRDNIKRLFERVIGKGRHHLEFSGIALSWKEVEIPESGGLVLKDVVMHRELETRRKKPTDPSLQIVQCGTVSLQFDAQTDVVALTFTDSIVLEGPGRDIKFDKPWTLIHRVGGSKWARRLRYYTGPELVSMYLRLKDSEDQGAPSIRTSDEVLAKINERLSLSTASIFFVLIGAPLALVFRAGSRLVAFLLAFVVVLFVFYPTHLMAQTLTDQQLVHPVIAAWSGSLLLGFLGLGLLLFVVRR